MAETNIIEHEVFDDSMETLYTELEEGTFTKTIQLNSPYELSIVDKLAEEGWLLCTIVPYNDVFVYWFQSKKKIYVNSKAHLHENS